MTWGRSLGIGPEPATLTPLPPQPRSRLGSKVAVQRGGQHRILASVCVAAGGGEQVLTMSATVNTEIWRREKECLLAYSVNVFTFYLFQKSLRNEKAYGFLTV